jgi:hypothetical protein
MQCPQVEPKQEDDGLFDLAPDTAPPKPVRPVLAAAPVAIAPGHAAPMATSASGMPLQYRSPKSDEKASGEPNQLMDLWAPLFLIGGSVVGEILAVFIQSHGNSVAMGQAMLGLSVNMIVGTVFMVVGMWLAAKSRGLSLGSPLTALLKLGAIALAPGAAMDLVMLPLKVIPLFGWLIAWVIGFMLYFALIGTLFELDQEDTWYCVMVIFCIKVATFVGLIFGVAAILHHS